MQKFFVMLAIISTLPAVAHADRYRSEGRIQISQCASEAVRAARAELGDKTMGSALVKELAPGALYAVQQFDGDDDREFQVRVSYSSVDNSCTAAEIRNEKGVWSEAY